MTVAPLAALLLAWLAAHGQDPAAADPGTWILQIEGDADSLAVSGASHRAFAYRAPRSASSDYRVTLVDRAGRTVATAPLDLSAFCLDPTHRGRPAHVRGDVVLEHAVVITVKVPARADAASLRFENVADPAKPVVLGTIDRADLLAVLGKATRGDAGEKTKEKNGTGREQRKER